MSYDQLKDFVEAERSNGASDDDIRTALETKHWNNELINKALGDDGLRAPTPEADEVELSSKILSVPELFAASWDEYTRHFKRYFFCSLTVVGLAFATLVVFTAPIIFDTVYLKLTPKDLVSPGMLPVLIPHLIIGGLVFIIMTAWASLALKTMAVHRGEITVGMALRKAWSRVPGFIWVGILEALVVIGGLFLLIIPGLIMAFLSLFATMAYVAHGARGRAAIAASISLVKPHWAKVLGRFALLILIAAVLGGIIGGILPNIGGTIVNLFLAPFVAVFMFTMYDNLMKRSKVLEETK